jgi:hypothetical protein
MLSGVRGLLVLLVALAFPAGALAADVQVDRSCYLEALIGNRVIPQPVQVTGNGFTANEAYQVTIDGLPVLDGSGTVDAAGGISKTITPPALPEGTNERKHILTVSQGATSVSTSLRVSRFLADFAPSSGDPRTLRVRFSVFGFGLASANPTVYLHYVRPGGKLKRTVKLGRAAGPCGRIARAPKRRLFPFTATRGRWRLQFDTNKRYRKGRSNSAFPFYSVPVDIRLAG